METLRIMTPKTLLMGPLLAALLLTGCTGIEPFEPHDYRREGPKTGLFTGSEGEFVIYSRADRTETVSKTSKRSDETAAGEQQKLDSGKEDRNQER